MAAAKGVELASEKELKLETGEWLGLNHTDRHSDIQVPVGYTETHWSNRHLAVSFESTS